MSIEERISKLFSQLKLRKKLKGYDYLFDAVLLRYHNPAYKGKIYVELYKEIAEKYHTRIHCVERNIRNIIDSTWTNEYAEAQYELYADAIPKGKDKPPAAIFIEHTVELLRMSVFNDMIIDDSFEIKQKQS